MVVFLLVAAGLLAAFGSIWSLPALYYGLVIPLLQWVVRDMKSRGRPGWVYILWLVLSPVIGLVGYLVDRRRFPVQQSV